MDLNKYVEWMKNGSNYGQLSVIKQNIVDYPPLVSRYCSTSVVKLRSHILDQAALFTFAHNPVWSLQLMMSFSFFWVSKPAQLPH